jgi:tight adherence protein C
MSGLRGTVVVLVGLVGVITMVSALPRFRRATLARRLVPYLGAFGPRRSRLLQASTPMSGWWVALDPVRESIGARLHRVLDDAQELPERLEAAGSTLEPSGFRAEQVTWAMVGLVGGLGFGILLVAVGRAPSPGLVLGLAGLGAVGGVVARDRSLSRQVVRRRVAVQQALPTVVDLVCLSVTAGESLRAALGMVAEGPAGPLGQELRRAIRSARSGMPLVSALEARARTLGSPEFDRFVDAVVAAQERGLPLADALRSLAFDLREQERRQLIEAAGRKQISMLVPVVTLILPVAIVFAFYPGVVAIRTLAR